jgi:hypothetical protein
MNDHGKRVEERQRVNHKPNGYSPVSEAELKMQRLDPLKAARVAAVMHPDPEVARALTAELAKAA